LRDARRRVSRDLPHLFQLISFIISSFDIDFPIECDDEYLEQSELENTCKQPPDTPSVLAFFISYLKLNQILAFVLRTIYATNEAKKNLGFVGHQWDQHIVAELDSALNKWFDDIPDHLRWDPSREDEIFSTQSTCTQTSYYQLRILIHRPFISSKTSPLSFSSLAVCINAARSCIHVSDIQRLKSKNAPLPHLHADLFTAGITLLLSIWSSKRSGFSIDADKEMDDVQKCLTAFQICEHRWHSAGRLWDVLYGLANAGGVPLPKSPGSLSKRARDSDEPKSVSPSIDSLTPSPSPIGVPYSIAGSKRVSQKNISRPPAAKPAAALQSNSLLTCNDAVVQLPVHSQGNLSASQQVGDFWTPAPGDITAVPVQSHTSTTLDSSNDLDGMLTAALPLDPIYYGQMENILRSSSEQVLGAAQGQYDASRNHQLDSLSGMDPLQEQLQIINNDAFAV